MSDLEQSLKIGQCKKNRCISPYKRRIGKWNLKKYLKIGTKKTLQINLKKDVRDPYTKDCKILLKETKEDWNEEHNHSLEDSMLFKCPFFPVWYINSM